MRVWWALFLTAAVRVDDGVTTAIRADARFPTPAEGDDSLTHCEKLERALDVPTDKRKIFVQGRAVPLVVLWDGHAPARAVSALLHALVTRGLGYQGVSLDRSEEQPLADAVYSNTSLYDEYEALRVWPAAAQRVGARAGRAECAADRLCALRVAALAPGAAPAAVTLLAHLATDVADDPVCKALDSWLFYGDIRVLEYCRFVQGSGQATVYYLSEYKSIADELSLRAAAHDLRWRFVELGKDTEPRIRLLQLLRAGNHSFLFIDHEVWSTYPRVIVSQPPPCASALCPTSLDPVYTVRLATVLALDQFLPNVLNIVRKFSPTHQEIRQILEEEADLTDNDVEEAACLWSSKNIARFTSWFENELTRSYWVIIFLCTSDPDYQEYRHVIQQTYEAMKSDLKSYFELQSYDLNCSNDYDMTNIISMLQNYRKAQSLIGVVGVGEGAKTAAANADKTETVLVLYDSVGEEHSLGEATRVMGGPVSQLALAVAWFLGNCEWERLAVLSDRTSLGKVIYDELSKTKLVLRNKLLLSYTDAEFKEYLELFREVNAKIFYLNMDANTAARVLCAAMDIRMTYDEGYIWLVREWRAENRTCGSAETRAAMRHYTMSFWWRGQETNYKPDPTGVDTNLTEKLQSLWPDRSWPVLAMPLANALSLLLRAADTFLTRHPDRASDMHGSGTARVFWASMNDTEVPGVRGGIRASADVSAAVVYIDEWRRGAGARPRSLAVWPAAPRGEVRAVCGGRTDGGKRCIVSRWYKPGESFEWRCYDWAVWACALAAGLAAPALLAARRARLALLRRDEMLRARHTARTRRALASHVVSRARLQLRHELGAGRFGRVRLAVLRAPARATQLVAAKALPDDASPSEEGDFLQEASTLASLEHEHIVRLVGVCTRGGPPLVLMEFAFFGDLSAYLRQRRHLAERLDEANEEAEHVSAANLTRLASEAASALAYLATKRLVHRDVRAANCLVDARRSLKLADFGLARQTAGEEYACARRGLFPVLWMAPESLDRGVFSAASDVWALGVLMFELVTLGERPYGDWNPLHVFRYVVGGGTPPLPPDASIKTIGILTSCWSRLPEQRPSAEAVCAYLRARPAALTPALAPAPPPAHTHTHTPLSLYSFVH